MYGGRCRRHGGGVCVCVCVWRSSFSDGSTEELPGRFEVSQSVKREVEERKNKGEKKRLKTKREFLLERR